MRSFALSALLLLAACASTSRSDTVSTAGRIDPVRMSNMVRTLASDEFEGRAPGTAGEAKTIAYIEEQFRLAGLEPAGENGGWTQRVPLVRTQLGKGSVSVATKGGTLPMRMPQDVYLSTVREIDRARIEGAPMVFVGYGVSAPERRWDDFKDVDLKGKVAVFLVNDPDFESPASYAKPFGGKAMTYYGRWTYKFEEAARRKAIAALLVHDTAGAGYGWSTVQAPAGENYNVVLKPGDQQPVLLQGWIQRPVAEELFRRAGLSFGSIRQLAQTAGFHPVDLGARFSADLAVEATRVESRNVLGKIGGSRRPDETIWFASHWDAYGVGAPDARGKRVRPGALDSASGIAGIVELARAFKAGPAPERTMVFAAWTAEERGLLGAQHYSNNPLFPMEKAVANLTLDTLQPNGLARDVVLIGQGQSNLEERLAEAAARQGRTVTPDAKPERGLFYRADHFAFARRGVPVLLLMALGGGVDLVEGGRERGDRWVTEFTANCYHQTCDEWRPDLDFRGAAQDVALFYDIGRGLAFGSDWPEWNQGSEFREIRERTAAARR